MGFKSILQYFQCIMIIMSIRIILCVLLIFSSLVACVLSGNVDQYTVSSIIYNPETSFSGRIHRLLHGDYSPPKAAFSSEKHYPPYVYKPNCSIELVMQTWTKKNPKVPHFGEGELSIPTISKSKSWQCYYRSSWLNNDEALPSSTDLLSKERYLTTIVYCPSMISSSSSVKNSKATSSNFGMCSLLNTAITKEGGHSIKLVLQMSSIETVLMRTDKSEQAVSQKSRRHAGLETKYTTNTMEKTQVTLVEKAPLLTGDESESAALDKCAADWADLTIVGRCFGLKTHTEYPQYKQIPLVQDASHCKSLCCELGKKCVTWQYWTEIKLCKLGDAVRIGTEQAQTPLWCDSEPPITWSGYKVTRLSSGNLLVCMCVCACFGVDIYCYTICTMHSLTVQH